MVASALAIKLARIDALAACGMADNLDCNGYPIVVEGRGYTMLAMQLDLAMSEDSDARARYLATYGTEWIPLAFGESDAELVAVDPRTYNVDSESTRASTAF
jgi:hypothetical protein